MYIYDVYLDGAERPFTKSPCGGPLTAAGSRLALLVSPDPSLQQTKHMLQGKIRY